MVALATHFLRTESYSRPLCNAQLGTSASRYVAWQRPQLHPLLLIVVVVVWPAELLDCDDECVSSSGQFLSQSVKLITESIVYLRSHVWEWDDPFDI